MRCVSSLFGKFKIANMARTTCRVFGQSSNICNSKSCWFYCSLYRFGFICN